jgi:hypothetical protein
MERPSEVAHLPIVALGPDRPGRVDPAKPGGGLETPVRPGVAFILFEGGMSLRLRETRTPGLRDVSIRTFRPAFRSHTGAERVEYRAMKGYGQFWVLLVLLAALSILVHVALWKWAVMKRLKERAKNAPRPAGQDPSSPRPR